MISHCRYCWVFTSQNFLVKIQIFKAKVLHSDLKRPKLAQNWQEINKFGLNWIKLEGKAMTGHETRTTESVEAEGWGTACPQFAASKNGLLSRRTHMMTRNIVNILPLSLRSSHLTQDVLQTPFSLKEEHPKNQRRPPFFLSRADGLIFWKGYRCIFNSEKLCRQMIHTFHHPFCLQYQSNGFGKHFSPFWFSKNISRLWFACEDFGFKKLWKNFRPFC